MGWDRKCPWFSFSFFFFFLRKSSLKQRLLQPIATLRTKLSKHFITYWRIIILWYIQYALLPMSKHFRRTRTKKNNRRKALQLGKNLSLVYTDEVFCFLLTLIECLTHIILWQVSEQKWNKLSLNAPKESWAKQMIRTRLPVLRKKWLYAILHP